jgi:hypothetical protein
MTIFHVTERASSAEMWMALLQPGQKELPAGSPFSLLKSGVTSADMDKICAIIRSAVERSREIGETVVQAGC